MFSVQETVYHETEYEITYTYETQGTLLLTASWGNVGRNIELNGEQNDLVATKTT